MPSQEQLVFGFVGGRGFEVQSLMLVRSLRQFGEDLSNLPVWIFVPEGEAFESSVQQDLLNLQTQIYSCRIDKPFRRFPFALKAVAAAEAENLAEKHHYNLAWHDRTGLIRHAPKAFILPPNKTFGFRPTDIANIGAQYGHPLPLFWQRISDHFNISLNQLPAITTVIDRKRLHLYINAGLLVVKPDKHILRKWAENLRETYAQPEFKRFYQEDQRYAIFMHQAALTAAVVQQTNLEDRLILPENYLFSVDNFLEYLPELRPESLDQITTGRFHDFFALDNWEDLIVASDDMIGWFKAQLEEGLYWPVHDK